MPGTGGTPGTGGAPGTGGSGGGVSLDQCFANLATPTTRYQIATKASADGGTRMRLAMIVPAGGVGTSGTLAWQLVRFGIERGTVSTCVTDAAQLKYTTSLHNCSDKATATANGVVYAITAPDRATAMVSASGAAAFPSTQVMNNACKSSDSNKCGSGGPCQ
jgi:hypothetical protein